MQTKQEIITYIIENVLFAKEAADYLNISTQRLNQLVHSGFLRPLKRGLAGTLFLKSDLDRRILEKESIGKELTRDGGGQPMKLDSPLIIEAINYFALKLALKCSDKNAEPVFKDLSGYFKSSEPMDKDIEAVARIAKVSAAKLVDAFRDTRNGFMELQPDDLIIKRGNFNYPKLLEKTNEAPLFLFMRGNLELLKEKIVAVVGTRNPTPDGAEKANRLAKLLSSYKIVVASGLARGIDTAAHTGAMGKSGLTIAVIGTPLTMAYPSENSKLQERISKEGLLISQFAPGTPVQRWNFPVRNGVMSGISLATVVIEAGETSGALKQADYALKQNHLVFIPQSALDNHKIKWPQKYIKRPGAFSFKMISELMEKLEKEKIIQETEPKVLQPELGL